MAITKQQVSLFTEIPDYTTLQELVGEFLNRSDAGTLAMVPLFINMAEKTILRNLRIPAMEVMKKFTWGDYVASPGLEEGYMYIPGDYLEMVDIWTPEGLINRVSFSELKKREGIGSAAVTSGSGNPTTEETYNPGCGSGSSGNGGLEIGMYDVGIYARNANRWYFLPVPAAETEIYLTYYKDPSELSEELDTSDLLTLLPDAILYMSIAEGHRFLMEEEKATYYEQLGHERVKGVTDQVEEAEFSGGVLQINVY
jgi:hypothetical protein